MIDATADGAPGQPLTKSGYAYQVLRQRILDGELVPGERLLLRPLADRLGVSVMPVRDALRLLERDGLVRSESHRGATVTPISPGVIVELIGIRMWLEVLAAQEAARRHTPQTLAVVAARIDDADAALAADDPLLYTRANRAVHEAAEAPASPELRGLVDELWERVWQSRRRTSLFALAPEVRTEAQAEHRALLVALETGDPDAAGAAMLAHRASTIAAWRRALGDLTSASTRPAGQG